MKIELIGRLISLTEENVDIYLRGLYDGTKEQNIQLHVSFSKDDLNQMELLRLALLEPHDFSCLCKQLLSIRFSDKLLQQVVPTLQPQPNSLQEIEDFTPESVDIDTQTSMVTKQGQNVFPTSSVSVSSYNGNKQSTPTSSSTATTTGRKIKKRPTSRGHSLSALLKPNPDAK